MVCSKPGCPKLLKDAAGFTLGFASPRDSFGNYTISSNGATTSCAGQFLLLDQGSAYMLYASAAGFTWYKRLDPPNGHCVHMNPPSLVAAVPSRPPPPPPHPSLAGDPTKDYLVGTEATCCGAATTSLKNGPEIRGCGDLSCAPEPMHFAITPWFNQQEAVNAAASAATAGADFASAWNQESRMEAIAQYVYFIRICNEWQGNAVCGPFVNGDENQGEAVDPTTWTNGIKNTIKAIRAHPKLNNIKIAIDGPLDTEQDKYILPLLGSDGVNLLANDAYIGTGGYYDWSSPIYSVGSWHGAETKVLAHFAGVADAYNRPMVFPEWCDKFDDGYVTSHFANWVNTHNVVAVVYWDDPGTLAPPESPCAVDSSPAKLAAYQKAFGNHKYAGTYWPVVIPWPNIVTWSPRSTQPTGQKGLRRILHNHR
jgi:hypothetical protein